MTIRITHRDLALHLVREADFEAQLLAIKVVLDRNQQHEEATASRISAFRAELCHAPSENPDLLQFELMERLRDSAFLDAAHSMSAVGMLAPIVESLFVSIFQALRNDQQKGLEAEDPRAVASQNDYWNPHLVFRSGQKSTNLIEGIKQLSASTGLVGVLPDLLEETLSALFAYRNKMLHCGFEWPIHDRRKFGERIQTEGWPSEWFETSSSDDDPRIYYMSRSFIDHCLKTIDQVLDGVGKYQTSLHVRQANWQKGRG